MVVSGVIVSSAPILAGMSERETREVASGITPAEPVVEQPLEDGQIESGEQAEEQPKPAQDATDADQQTQPSAESVDAEPENDAGAIRSDDPVETANAEGNTTAEAAGAEQSSEPVIDVAQVEASEPDDLGAMQEADTTPADQPETGGTGGELLSPDAQSATGDVVVGADQPVQVSVQSEAPQAPGGENNLSISTDPAQPPLPESEMESSGFATSDEPADDQQTDQVAVLADPVISAEGAETGVSGIIEDQADDVTTGRLPSVGFDQKSPEPESEPETVEITDPALELAEEDPRALARFAAEFENPDNKPLMSIILIDDGSQPAIDQGALKRFPFPVSFAVDVTWPGAGAAAQKYRDAGFEVMALVNLPKDAAGRDTEVAMQTYLTTVSEAVAVMEGTGTGLQASREASEQLIPILKESGHGLVMLPNGLNTAQKIIAREGVPALTAFRDFDAKGQGSKVIRRFLDHAAFKASQNDEGVIMVGRLREETVSALLLWGLQGRSSSVAMAPVSAVLLN